jgi:O-antigen ligase
MGLFRGTALNFPIGIYISVCLVSTLLGILRGYASLTAGILYFVKYFEYFLIFFMVTHSLKDKKQVRVFIYSMVVVVFIISIYSWILHFSGVERVTAPFEGKSGEPNTLGGYLLLMMMIIAGLLLNSSQRKLKISLLVVLSFAFPAFLFTLSRGSWLGFLPAFFTLIVLTKRGKNTLVITSLVLILLFLTIFPQYVYDRIEYTFSQRTTRDVLGIKLGIDQSTAARIDTWREGLKIWGTAPILGQGAGSAGAVVDSQYARLLIEVGVVGFIAFILMIIAIFRASVVSLNANADDNFISGITVGFIAALVGLLFHAIGAATFILIRIMEPFWFLAAIVMVVSQLPEQMEPVERLG